jgi:DNA-directed RNA polymerase subunit beta'
MADPKEMIFHNRVVGKGQLKKLVAWAFTKHGSARSAQMADQLKDLGFRFATRAGYLDQCR